ncbi:Protein of unknown function [Friedmanniella luteola]|uniref:DUF3099 domain-containing protein n=1 Tax=Friedmanniella luteola TaxID=546871 RepID=A0A1H1PQX9_9ACTN|nr:DUF3099 domain-containing protein [Friedmanniella luteola]SDS13578.1 Protein of unknown function [Friedmanniella luteola]
MADPAQDADPGRRPPGRPVHPAGAAPRGRPAAATLITDARTPSSQEMSRRVRRYAITMGFRTACFLSMLVVHGWPRWVLLGCAVFLPYVAVVLANQSDQRTRTGRVERGAPADAPQLTTGEHPEVVAGDVVEGSVEDDDLDEREGRVA